MWYSYFANQKQYLKVGKGSNIPVMAKRKTGIQMTGKRIIPGSLDLLHLLIYRVFRKRPSQASRPWRFD